MLHIAKIFRNGKSQAVRLPKEFRFDCNEVYVRRDPANGDVILSRKPGSWKDYFELMKSVDVPEDFMAERSDSTPQKRALFE
jgi:antitoxin VapB